MQTLAVWSVSLLLMLMSLPGRGSAQVSREATGTGQRLTGARQLAAVRGEIIKLAPASKGMLLITVKPAKEFQEVTVLARENDLVGAAVARAGGADLLGLLTDDARDDETIPAAELNEGDIVSIIYDPLLQNRALEIYIR